MVWVLPHRAHFEFIPSDVLKVVPLHLRFKRIYPMVIWSLFIFARCPTTFYSYPLKVLYIHDHLRRSKMFFNKHTSFTGRTIHKEVGTFNNQCIRLSKTKWRMVGWCCIARYSYNTHAQTDLYRAYWNPLNQMARFCSNRKFSSG